jgi:drug/metabolite transporter (DMT)-like permease
MFGLTRFKEFAELKKKDWLKLVFIGLIGGSIPFLLFFRGLQLTAASSASLIHKTMFVFVIIFAVLFLKEKLHKKVLAATGILLLSNYLLIKPNLSFTTGDFLILIATLFWASENIFSKFTLKTLSGNMVAFGRMFFGSLFILVFLLITSKSNLLLTLTTPQITWILITSGLLFLYLITWYNGLKYVEVSLATSILLLGSPITLLLRTLTGTPLTIDTAIAILLMLTGLTIFLSSSQQLSVSEFKSWLSKKVLN